MWFDDVALRGLSAKGGWEKGSETPSCDGTNRAPSLRQTSRFLMNSDLGNEGVSDPFVPFVKRDVSDPVCPTAKGRKNTGTGSPEKSPYARVRVRFKG